MHDVSALTEARVTRFRTERLVPAIYARSIPLVVEHWSAPGEPVPFEVAASAGYEPAAIGQPWGPAWDTTWFRLSGSVPLDWPIDAPVEVVVDLGFTGAAPGFQAEGLAWTEDGEPIAGIHPRNRAVRVAARPGETLRLFVEAAANPDVGRTWDFSPTPLGDRATAGSDPVYRFGGAVLAAVDIDAFAIERDWATLLDLLTVLPRDAPRRGHVLAALDQAADLHVGGDLEGARARLRVVLDDPADPGSHRMIATGHAHIDSAWLWPLRESVRKCARTFANVLDLMGDYDEFVFAASSALHYDWMKRHYPAIFERIRQRVAEGRWIPVGGMWVESDTNMPGGEALVRQILQGKRFFLDEFGIETDDVWLPDSFGYTAALPQIAASAGMTTFLTQKTSKNEVNRIPHSTFWWEGIDGTRLLAHLPPVDTYHSELAAAELDQAVAQNGESGRFDVSLVPFGYGDGGGGPTREMIELGRRKANLLGSPRIELATPGEFFARARAEFPSPDVWSGELYLELHRGTYTSQARTKLGNRRSEHLLREAELWAATAAVRTGAEYPAEQLRDAWRTVLTNQFHDILAGAGIAWVHQQAELEYAGVATALEAILTDALRALGGSSAAGAAANASPFDVDGIPALGIGPRNRRDGVVRADGTDLVLEGDRIIARVDAEGRLVSLVDVTTGRDAFRPTRPGNVLQLFEDLPAKFDAWELDISYRRMPAGDARTVTVAADGEAIRVDRAIGSSTVAQWIRVLDGGAGVEVETVVDWAESQRVLKLAFPLDVHAERFAAEIQFGHLNRPIAVNTSWDAARFEISGQRWVRVEEPGFGVTIANDRVYGRDVVREPVEGGGVSTVIRETLLRAPRFPDPGADAGTHRFRHAIVLGSMLEGIAEGYRLNLPPRDVAAPAVEPLITVEGDGIIVEAVKLAEDGSGDVVVRLYEALGRRARGSLRPGFPAARATRTDLLERELPGQPADALALDLRAFELVTLRLART
jgi:alpha-mannosidase